MSLDKFLRFIIEHNATIIEVLIGLTLLGALFLAVRSFLLVKDPLPASGSLDLGSLEETLKQIIEKAGQVPVTGSTEESQKLVSEIADLKTQLEHRQKELEELKANPAGASADSAGAGGGMSDEERKKLEAQIAELNGKLSEYEIISEDIADLSFYKEQNAKLQKELDSIKASGGASAAAPVAAATPAPALSKVEPEIVGRAVSREEESPTGPVAAVEPAVPEPPAPEVNVVDDDLMAEFAAAVEKQKSGETVDAVAAAIPTPGVAAAAEAPAVEEAATVDLGQMDMDKMMAEAAGIKADVPEVDPEKALGTGLDENKLLQEAAALEAVTPEDQKLMGEFENFVKKSES